MNNLRTCETCIYGKQTKEAKICTREPKMEMNGKLYHLQSFERNQGACGISAIYHTPIDTDEGFIDFAGGANLEQLETIFDGLEDEKPKSKIEIRETF